MSKEKRWITLTASPNPSVEVDVALCLFLEEAAKYFEMRPTRNEDSAHWSNVYNAQNCRKAAARIRVLAGLSHER